MPQLLSPNRHCLAATNYVIEYRWSGLDISAGTPLAITFALAGGPSGSNFAQKPVDFVSLDVSSVPEPVRCALGIVADSDTVWASPPV